MATLFGKVKAGDQRNAVLAMFAHIVAATAIPPGYAVVPSNLAEKADKAEPGVIEINKAIPADASGNVQVRATTAGIAAFAANAANPTPAAASTPKVKPTFELETGIQCPEAKRGGIRESSYPFDSMPVGASFFIPATAENPNPAKQIGSTISSANKRYAAVYPANKSKGVPHPKAGQNTGKDGRRFTVRPRTTADGEKSNGARVWRVA